MKLQGKTCAEECWSHFGQITPRPTELRQCFEKKGDIIDNFTSCFKDNVNECTDSRSGPMIPRQNFENMFRHTEKTLRKSGNDAMQTALIAPLRKVWETTQAFYDCFKNCLREKNPGGVCLSKYGCQPKLPSEAHARDVVKVCMKGLDLKREGGAMCTCA
uniref:Uncharacterized protein n=1 Tax=Plectus sambesii TaxID=2011161 RepID=A0A914V9Q9_9BILA